MKNINNILFEKPEKRIVPWDANARPQGLIQKSLDFHRTYITQFGYTWKSKEQGARNNV